MSLTWRTCSLFVAPLLCTALASPVLASADEISVEETPSTIEVYDMATSFRFDLGEEVEDEQEIETAISVMAADPYAIAPLANNLASWSSGNGRDSFNVGSMRVGVPGTLGVGIDVSEHNKSINWNQVKQGGIDYAIIRCGYGQNYSAQDDKYFSANISGARSSGMPFGIYLYSYATNTAAARSEAEHVLRLLRDHNIYPQDLQYPVFYDLEEASNGRPIASNSMLNDMAKVFCDTISAQGYPVGIYSSENWWNSYLTGSFFQNSNLYRWVAKWPASSVTNSGIGNTAMWQFRNDGSVSGINGRVDMNFNYVGNYNKVEGITDGWHEFNGVWYLFKDKTRTSGWQSVNGTWYYLSSRGAMQTGWSSQGGAWYYLKSSGAMATGWAQVGGTWYYFNKAGQGTEGVMRTGWIQDDGVWYYLNQSGAMLTGWQYLGGTWYYFNGSGAMLTGWRYIGGTWYYLASSGAMKTGWLELDGVWYYLNGSGAMLTGEHKIDGVTYYFNESGAWV